MPVVNGANGSGNRVVPGYTCRLLALILCVPVGCTSNRFQLANRRTDPNVGQVAGNIVPPYPQAGPPVGQPAIVTTTPAAAIPAMGDPMQPAGQFPVQAANPTAPMGPAGANEFAGLNQGAIVAGNPAGSLDAGHRSAIVPEQPRPGPPGTVRVAAPNGPELVGRVLDVYGRPVPFVSIQVRDITRSQIVAEVASATQGAFRIRNLVPGVQYELTAIGTDRGRRLTGSTLAVAPDTAVIIQVAAQGSGDVSQMGGTRFDHENTNFQPASNTRGYADPVVKLGFGYTQVITPRLLETPLVATVTPPQLQTAAPLPTAPVPVSNQNAPAGPKRYRVPEHPGTGRTAVSTPIAFAGTSQPHPAIAGPQSAPPSRPSDIQLSPATPPVVAPAATAPVANPYAFQGTPLARMQLLTTNGQSRPMEQLSGKLILLDFFGSWCGPCRQCVPKLNALQRDYEGSGLRVVGVACENGAPSEALASAEQARQELAIQYAVLVSPMDIDSPLRDHFGVTRYPTLVLLDRQGNVLFSGTGGSGDTFDRLRSAIDKALAGF